MIRLTKTGFRQWLIKNRRVLVGRPSEIVNCPFCKYLKSKGAERVRIPDVRYRIMDGRKQANNKWQRDFQRQAMDMERRLDVIGLRGGEAIDILDSV